MTGTKFDFVVPVETGGFNSVTPLHAGALKGLPVVDADGAGRAVPELQMTTFHTYWSFCFSHCACRSQWKQCCSLRERHFQRGKARQSCDR
ncbi:MAG: hypothetical protein DRP33_00565 [Thermotogae bacterium]|nr:MAG: hypothetical protein DRP33_00565 [Thermotogota bacterium]